MRLRALAGTVLLLGTGLLPAAVDPARLPGLAELLHREESLVGLDGETVPLRHLTGNDKPLVIEFWATWCAPCRKNLPHLVSLQKKYGDRLVVLGLTVEDPASDMEKVRTYVRAQGVNFTVAFAPNTLFQFMNRRPDIAVPKLFVFDAAGHTLAYIPRYSLFTRRKLESAVARAFSHDAKALTGVRPLRIDIAQAQQGSPDGEPSDQSK